jgi:hypothetical protein
MTDESPKCDACFAYVASLFALPCGGGCMYFYCKSCAEKLLRHAPTCGFCKQPRAPFIAPALAEQRRLEDKHIWVCEHHAANGHVELQTRAKLQKHLETCEYKPAPPPQLYSGSLTRGRGVSSLTVNNFRVMFFVTQCVIFLSSGVRGLDPNLTLFVSLLDLCVLAVAFLYVRRV